MLKLGIFAASLILLTSNSTNPTFPGGGGIVAWIVCHRNRRNEIGGWLLFFFWQLYGGLLMTAVLFASNIQSYVPENFENGEHFELFLP